MYACWRNNHQWETIAHYAKANQIDLVGEYCDEGTSGTKELADRPGLAALLDRLETTGVSVVLIERADRIARDLAIGNSFRVETSAAIGDQLGALFSDR